MSKISHSGQRPNKIPRTKSIYIKCLNIKELNKFGRGWRTDNCSLPSPLACHMASSSDKEEELTSASASDSRDYKSIFSNGGRTAIGRSTVSTEVGLVVAKGFNAD
ncbi:hypothetical protein AVEN_87586-1 [Araneus ventricosus]|uniref:Uncharacterized protein n=1 Tax=Araneus ventricosus TaxID=182803 RepID=A0A4Y2LQV8_ARAVE|nr:hypothetical protein AVEN_87586-1 [Araneus ventricosus]